MTSARAHRLEDLPPAEPDLERTLDEGQARRVALATSCRDADDLPKVSNAGMVMDRGGERVQVMHNGLLIAEGCYYGPWMTHVIHGLRGHHEPQEERVFAAVLHRLRASSEPLSMIELGSHWAYYSMWFAREFPGSRVVAMEPDPEYLRAGRHNFELNGLRATFVEGVIGGEPGTQTTFTAESTGEDVIVPVHDVASLMAAADVPRVDLLLADIQGYEVQMIERLGALVASGSARFVIVSTHHWRISGNAATHRLVCDGVRALGGHIIAEHSVAESFSGDGLVAASFDPQDSSMSVTLSRARAADSLFGEPEAELAAVMAERDELELEVERLRRCEPGLAAPGRSGAALHDGNRARLLPRIIEGGRSLARRIRRQ